MAATKLVELQKICYKETRGQVFGQHFLQKKRSCIDMKIMLSCAHYLQLLVSSARHTVISINRLHIMSNEVRVVYATPFVLKVGACFRSRRARLSELKKQTWALRHAGRNHVTEIISRGLQRLQKPAVALQRFLQLLQPRTKNDVGIHTKIEGSPVAGKRIMIFGGSQKMILVTLRSSYVGFATWVAKPA